MKILIAYNEGDEKLRKYFQEAIEKEGFNLIIFGDSPNSKSFENQGLIKVFPGSAIVRDISKVEAEEKCMLKDRLLKFKSFLNIDTTQRILINSKNNRIQIFNDLFFKQNRKI